MILDDTGPVPRGTPGTLAVSNRDPGLMLGYRGAEDDTRAKFQGDWFLTGDTVSMAEDGALTYLGRADDMMNAGGVPGLADRGRNRAERAPPALPNARRPNCGSKPTPPSSPPSMSPMPTWTQTELGRFASTALPATRPPRIYPA